MTRNAKGLVAAAAAAVLLALAIAYTGRLALESPLRNGSAERTVVIEPGDSLNAVVGRLESQAILERPWLFKLAAYLKGSAGRIQAGEYRIHAGDTHRLLIARMVDGDVVQHYFTIIEGWTVSGLARDARLRGTAGFHPDCAGCAQPGGRTGAGPRQRRRMVLPRNLRLHARRNGRRPAAAFPRNDAEQAAGSLGAAIARSCR